MFEGDLEQGELEIGQVAAGIRAIQPAGDVVREIIAEYRAAQDTLAQEDFRF
jgi:enoyl-[acyl-carrier protein] reductase II